MRLIFMGTPDFSVPALDALIAAGHEIVMVFSQPPRAAGRGMTERPGPVHARAAELGLAVRTPISLRDAAEAARFASLDADAAVVVAYGLILPRPTLDAPRLGCLNIHASLLPRWRGAAPIQRAIMAGDAETGVCIMQMEVGLDTGPVLHRVREPIRRDDTAGSLHDRLSGIGARAIVEVLEKPAQFPPQEQAGTGICYAAKIDKAEARIDWTVPAPEIDCKVRGLSPFPGAWTELDGQRLKLLLSEVRGGTGTPGEVLDGDLTVAAGQDAVGIRRLQRPGKAVSDAADFLRGTPVRLGDRFR